MKAKSKRGSGGARKAICHACGRGFDAASEAAPEDSATEQCKLPSRRVDGKKGELLAELLTLRDRAEIEGLLDALTLTMLGGGLCGMGERPSSEMGKLPLPWELSMGRPLRKGGKA